MPHSQATLNDTINLAKALQNNINANFTRAEKNFRSKMKKMLENPQSKVMLIELLDRSFRSHDAHAAYELISHILEKHGIADFFSPFEKILLYLFLSAGKLLPNLSVPFFIKNLKSQTKTLVLEATPLKLQNHALSRLEQGIILNVNLIGEEVLGELEANYRVQKYIDALNSTYINYISIKITTIFSQINPLDFDYSKREIIKRLDKLYTLAESRAKQGFEKFINLDMEEFKDLELTVAAFSESIAKFDICAGIVLQAYLPDSFEYLKKLVAFSKKRVASGKPAIKIRIVKGANMQTEQTLASVKGWTQPTFTRKIHTDSNYNKMLNFVLENENFKFVKIGIASHNIFQIAYAITRINHTPGAKESFTFEMLEGMNLCASFELAKLQDLILYAPVCDEAHFNNAIAYLVRRLDENTSEDNFMRHAFDLDVGSLAWESQERIFLESIRTMGSLNNESKRIQNRLIECTPSNLDDIKRRKPKDGVGLESFTNEPDTDFTLAPNREWAMQIKEKFEKLDLIHVRPIIGSDKTRSLRRSKKEVAVDVSNDSLETRDIFEKSRGKKIAEVKLADENMINEAIKHLKDSKMTLSFDELGEILLKTAEVVAERRGELIGIAALEVGKTFAESDAEVSEAIDFLRFYPHSVRKLTREHSSMKLSALGVGAVITPWNFPIAISIGGIAAALASGNRVLYKPSNLSATTGLFVVQCFYDAGVPQEYLSFLPATGEVLNASLSQVDFAILTGGEESAYKILAQNPKLFLSAETGGKNATIVSKMSDRDQAIKNIIHSAFSNSGQKCSATSLLILEGEVYDDANFKKNLIDAASSLNVGDPFDFKNKIGFLSEKLGEKAQRGLECESAEEWVLKPSFVGVCDSTQLGEERDLEHNERKKAGVANEAINPFAMRPAIKYGVREGSYAHRTEFFAPILSVMRAKDLSHALSIANSTGYGLTAGLESLDEREWDYFLENMQAGNLYINKPTTGAIVLRQPFGGLKKSAIGFGRKAGSYNYVSQFLRVEENSSDGKENIDGEKVAPHAIIDKLTHLLTSCVVNSSGGDLDSNESKGRVAGGKEREGGFIDEIKSAIKRAKNYAYFYENEFARRRDFVGICGEDNFFYYKSVGKVIYRVSWGDSLLEILSIIAACEVSGASLTLSFKPTQISEALGFLLENLRYLNLKNISVEYQNIEEFIKIAGDFGLIRYLGDALNKDVRSKDSENQREQIYAALIGKGMAGGKLIATHTPHANGYFELLYYFYEISASIAFHRYGNLGARGEHKA